MRSAVATSVVVVVLAACAPASIGSEPDTDIPLPDRTPASDSGPPSGGDAGPPASQNVALVVTLSGSGLGSITSAPSGVTCAGTTCKGSFARGVTVTLTPTPAAGSFFSGWTGGCTGAGACAPVMNGDVAVGADLESLDGTWSGTYTNGRMALGCTFANAGNLSAKLTEAGAKLSTTADVTGLELRSIPSCALVGSTTGKAPASDVTVSGNKLTGTWTFDVQGAGGTLAFPFVGTATGKTLTGTWTCSTCTGSFTLTKQ